MVGLVDLHQRHRCPTLFCPLFHGLETEEKKNVKEGITKNEEGKIEPTWLTEEAIAKGSTVQRAKEILQLIKADQNVRSNTISAKCWELASEG
jgi:hypothetical protein